MQKILKKVDGQWYVGIQYGQERDKMMWESLGSISFGNNFFSGKEGGLKRVSGRPEEEEKKQMEFLIETYGEELAKKLVDAYGHPFSVPMLILEK